MALFDIARASKSDDKNLSKRVKKSKVTTTVKRGSDILTNISEIKVLVETKLGEFKDNFIVIQTYSALKEYIDKAIEFGFISIDTETTGLNPMSDDIVGVCLYSPACDKAAYLPINHISYITGLRVEDQLDKSVVSEQLNRLIDTKVVMFNAEFDIRFLRNQLNVYLDCWWDCFLASKLLNENEESNRLKDLHQKYILNGNEDAFSFSDYFKNISFNYIPINVAYLYAAHDALITYELYEFQSNYLKLDHERDDMRDLAWVFFNIEMPCVKVVCDMEDTGIRFDFDYNNYLKQKYHNLLEDRINSFNEQCKKYKDEIQAYRLKMGANCKLDNPINIKSPTQLAILLYDIMKCQLPVDKRTKKESRSTNEATLRTLDNPISKAILEYREFSTIVDTFIDKLPECVADDGRIHCRFNQYGARTGRFSSSDPNLQNIPSHNKDIRKMFVASDGYVLMSSDYGQQEPKVMTQMCGDSKMIKAYKEGKDLYAEIAALSFNTTYENCLEFRPDGTTNPEGKARRSQAKSILLGVLYGRGVPSIAEQLGVSTKKAQAIKDSVFKGFPAIPKFEQDSLDMAYNYGYVTTLWGRKRRLPDLQLDEYEFKWKDGAPPDDDLLDFSLSSDEEDCSGVPEELQQKYLRKLDRAYFSEKHKIFEEANQEGIWIIDNGGKIADAQRQCVNARIQGSAADMSKLAMIRVANDSRLKELGFRLLVPVHDELIGECPEENLDECSKRFAQLMSEAAESKLSIPIKCDVEITKAWYGEALVGDKKQKETSVAREFENKLLGYTNNWVGKAQKKRLAKERRKV